MIAVIKLVSGVVYVLSGIVSVSVPEENVCVVKVGLSMREYKGCAGMDVTTNMGVTIFKYTPDNKN
jgi:hypothetical protein